MQQPAFPTLTFDVDGRGKIYGHDIPGMTLLDAFALGVLTGLLSCPEWDSPPKQMAKYCYDLAAAMMEEKAARESSLGKE